MKSIQSWLALIDLFLKTLKSFHNFPYIHNKWCYLKHIPNIWSTYILHMRNISSFVLWSCLSYVHICLSYVQDIYKPSYVEDQITYECIWHTYDKHMRVICTSYVWHMLSWLLHLLHIITKDQILIYDGHMTTHD